MIRTRKYIGVACPYVDVNLVLAAHVRAVPKLARDALAVRAHLGEQEVVAQRVLVHDGDVLAEVADVLAWPALVRAARKRLRVHLRGGHRAPVKGELRAVVDHVITPGSPGPEEAPAAPLGGALVHIPS